MLDDLVPEGQHDHPALTDPELRGVINRPEPAALPLITVLAAELVARHTGMHQEPPVAEALAVLRAGLAGDDAAPARPGLVDELTDLAGTLRGRLRQAPQQAEPGPVASPAERLLSQLNAVRAVAGALDPDPARAAWNVCWIAGSAVGRNFGDQLKLVVLDRCRNRATAGALSQPEPGTGR